MRRVSLPVVTVLEGDPVRLEFVIAMDSNGNSGTVKWRFLPSPIHNNREGELILKCTLVISLRTMHLILPVSIGQMKACTLHQC